MVDQIIAEGHAFCPQCGSELGVERNGVEPEDDDMLICPIHGAVMTLKEFRTQFVNDHRDEIDKQVKKVTDDAQKAIQDILRKAFKSK
jgi:uncharacterized Zn finger protein (UPF0148 family)